MSQCWDMPLLPWSPPYTYTCGAALLTTGKGDVTSLFHSFYFARILTLHLFFLLQTPLPATQITVGCRDLQYLQQCLFRPLFLIAQVCRCSWFDIHVEWHHKRYPTWGTWFFSVIFCRIILDEAALFLSDKANTVSVNLARGTWAMTMI